MEGRGGRGEGGKEGGRGRRWEEGRGGGRGREGWRDGGGEGAMSEAVSAPVAYISTGMYYSVLRPKKTLTTSPVQ